MKQASIFFLIAAWAAGALGAWTGDWQVCFIGGGGILSIWVLLPVPEGGRPWS